MKIQNSKRKKLFADSHKFAVSHRKGGFSLLEILIYISIFGGLLLVISNFLVNMVGGRDFSNSRVEVVDNLRFAKEKIRQMVFDSSSFTVYGTCPFNTFEATIGGATSTVQISSGILQFASGTSVYPLTSSSVTATTSAGCMFTKIVNPTPAEPTLQFDLTVSYNDSGNAKLKFSDSVKTTMGKR